jgi:hypothetical protein
MAPVSWRPNIVQSAKSEMQPTTLRRTCEAHLVVLAIDGNMLVMSFPKSLDRGLDVLHAARDTHFLGREVAVQSRSIPVLIQS